MREEIERKRKLKEQKEEEEFRSLTFSPNLPHKSAEIINTTRSHDSTDVYHRLNTTRTLSMSQSNLQLDTFSQSGQPQEELKKVVKDEKELQNLFQRLSATTLHSRDSISVEPTEQQKKVVLPKENVDAIFNRLRNSRTKSFILKYDSEEAEQILKQHSLLKDVPKIQTTELDGVLDRLRGHTLSSAASVDMKTLSRSSSFDLSVGVPGSPSVLQQTLARRMSVTNKTFVDSLERSVSPLNIVPRSLSPMPTTTNTNSRSGSPHSPHSIESRAISPPKRLAGLNVFEEITEEYPQDDGQDEHHYDVIENETSPTVDAKRTDRRASYLDEPETIVEDEQQVVPYAQSSASPAASEWRRSRSVNNNDKTDDDALLPTDALPKPPSIIASEGFLLPPVPPTTSDVHEVVDDNAHDGTTDLDSVQSPYKETEVVSASIENGSTNNVDLVRQSFVSDNSASSQNSGREAASTTMKKAAFVPQTLVESQQDLDNTMVSVDESDNF
jgi:hypothetical protein